MISPCINIGIGKDGITCLNGLARNFHSRESVLPTLMSFLTVDLEGAQKFNVYEKDKEEYVEYELPNKVDSELTDEHVFLAKAYNDLISILNVLHKSLQYTYINLNLVYSALEQDLTIIESFSNIVREYTRDGTFGTVIIKNFVIISDGIGILSNEEESRVTENLLFIESVKKNSPIVDTIFLLDDKNLKAIFLGYKNEYLSFALYEFIIAIMTNQYKVLSNLSGKSNFLSFGIGSIFFDKLYFNAYFDYAIFRKFLKNEKISLDGKNKYELSSLTEVKKIFNEYYSNITTDLEPVFDLVNIESNEKGDLAIGSYQYTLQLMLGEQKDRVIDVDNFVLKYNIKELIFNIIYKYVLEDKEKKEVLSVEEGKREIVRAHYQEIELSELRSLEEDDYKSDIEVLKSQLAEAKQNLSKYENQLKKSFFKYKKPLERKYIKLSRQQELSDKLDKLYEKKKLVELEHSKKFFINRLFSCRAFRNTIEEIEFEIGDLKHEISLKSKSVSEVQKALGELYELYELCETKNKRITSVINVLQDQGKIFERRWFATPYIDYSFVQNVIDLQLLKAYFKTNQWELTNNIKQSYSTLMDKDYDRYEILENYLDISINNRIGIIDFDATEYMLGYYDQMNLFTGFNFDEDIKKLQERGRPFINVIPTYIAQTHELYSVYNAECRDKVMIKIKDYFASTPPSVIDCLNKDRFLSINIESFNSIDNLAKSFKNDRQ
ncbi:hypothetical protein [Myroides pelagicus]|uniref:Uncharacterized protein n=1 Tax=Myroides pelagicus TaxID=270914 RepID=A0A7K1GK72_9FLAO|nr:hypothetical protein [Myroides pelagicus]MTH29208.1 hypothetical protein [Myroides pelagicus]